MERTLQQLKALETQAISLGEQMRREGAAYRAELEERQRLGLYGDAAIRHYNEFMERLGMSYLKVN